MTEANKLLNLRILSRLRLMRLESENVRQNQRRESNAYIFLPNNDLEEVAIVIATQGETGWKGSLYSLEYVDYHREHHCFIFAIQPQDSRNQEYLLVNFDSRLDAKYWIALGETSLRDIYYNWAKTARKPSPKFESNRMATNQWEINFWQQPPTP